MVYRHGSPNSRHKTLDLDPVTGAQGLRVLAAVGARVTGTPTTSLKKVWGGLGLWGVWGWVLTYALVRLPS